VDEYRESEGLEWNDDALHSVDLEYHNIDPELSLFHATQPRRYVSDLDIIDAMTDAPRNTRAYGRSQLVAEVLKKKNPRGYYFDWNSVILDRNRHFDLTDPFDNYEGLAQA
jgi:proteasome accessory factor A